VSDDLLAAVSAWAFAAPLWLGFWAVWTGRLRWLNDNLFGPFAVSFLPALALTVTLMGVSFATGVVALFWVAPVVFVVGIVLWFVVAVADPVWMQPAWAREELEERVDTRGRGAEFAAAVTAGPVAPTGHGELLLERPAVLLTDDVDRPAAVTVRHGRLGRLWVFTGAVVFAQNEAETTLRGAADPVEIALSSVRAVEATAPDRSLGNLGRMVRGDAEGRRFGRLLRVETATGAREFQVRGADEAARVIQQATGAGP
jgi:hypothetical protein